MMDIPFLWTADGYKLGHRTMLPPATTRMYGYNTSRTTRRVPDDLFSVPFGLQGSLQINFMERAYRTFFDLPRTKVVDDWKENIDFYLGPDHNVGVDHIEYLHDLQYLPLEFCAVPEGTHLPRQAPWFTVENTDDNCAWLTLYIETLVSDSTWHPLTSATTGFRFRRLIERTTELAGGNPEMNEFRCHDFSARGHTSPESAAASGAGFLLNFRGTDTLSAIWYLKEYYGAKGFVGGSVPATEHSVTCAWGKMLELEALRTWIRLHPKGILSIVSDTWSLRKLVREYLTELREEIAKREGTIVIRPDSGDPTKIMLGDEDSDDDFYRNGVYEELGSIFGWDFNAKGLRVLPGCINAIYGDAIFEERCEAMEIGAINKGIQPTMVYGVGSYSMQNVTRDTDGQAIKGIWAKVDGQEVFLEKDPETDHLKKSSTGRQAVVMDPETGQISRISGMNYDQWLMYQNNPDNILKPIWRNGSFLDGGYEDFETIRARNLSYLPAT